MRLLTYIKKTTANEQKVEIPRLLEEKAQDDLPVYNTRLRKAIISTITKTGLSYAKLNEELRAKGIEMSLATLHNIATNPHIPFGKYDTNDILPILSDIKSNYQTKTPTAWIDRETVKKTIDRWLNSPTLKKMAQNAGRPTNVFLRDLLGLKDDRLTFSHWKNGRYRVRAEKWAKATSAVKRKVGKI